MLGHRGCAGAISSISAGWTAFPSARSGAGQRARRAARVARGDGNAHGPAHRVGSSLGSPDGPHAGVDPGGPVERHFAQRPAGVRERRRVAARRLRTAAAGLPHAALSCADARALTDFDDDGGTAALGSLPKRDRAHRREVARGKGRERHLRDAPLPRGALRFADAARVHEHLARGDRRGGSQGQRGRVSRSGVDPRPGALSGQLPRLRTSPKPFLLAKALRCPYSVHLGGAR